jgi:hypothetical protein
MKRKVCTALGLSTRDWLLLVQAWGLLLLVDLALRLLPFTQVRDAAASALTQEAREGADVRCVQRMVGVTARHHLYPRRCTLGCRETRTL